MSEDDADDYEVGYGKPPMRTRFKKGQSGNSKGRPKGRKNASTTIQEALNETVSVNINGHRRKMTKLEASIQVLLQKALQGDPKAFPQILALAKVSGMLQQEPEGEQTLFPVADKDLIEAFLKRASGSGESGTGPGQSSDEGEEK